MIITNQYILYIYIYHLYDISYINTYHIHTYIYIYPLNPKYYAVPPAPGPKVQHRNRERPPAQHRRWRSPPWTATDTLWGPPVWLLLVYKPHGYMFIYGYMVIWLVIWLYMVIWLVIWLVSSL